jgi:hypothetical protein
VQFYGLLTRLNKGFLANKLVSSLVKKLPEFYATRCCITVFTRFATCPCSSPNSPVHNCIPYSLAYEVNIMLSTLSTIVNIVSTAQHRFNIFIYSLSINTHDMFRSYRPSSSALQSKNCGSRQTECLTLSLTRDRFLSGVRTKKLYVFFFSPYLPHISVC